MRRLTRTQRFRQIRRSVRVARLAERRRAARYAPLRPPPFAPGVPRVRIVLRGDLDLIENGTDTRVQLAQFDRAADEARRTSPLVVFVSMVDVTALDACALAYIFARHDELREIEGVQIHGRYPKHKAARQALADAGFDRYFRGRPIRVARHPLVKLRVGAADATFDPAEWRPLHQWLKSQPTITADDCDALYHAFGECVENVIQHAYEQDSAGHWYALAIKPTGNRPARAVIMDLGVGIPNTIRRDFGELIRRRAAWFWAWWLKFVQDAFGLADDDAALEAARRIAYDDWLCVYLASQGLRTQSAEGKRGTGLNWLRIVTCATGRGALHLLSGQTAVTWRANHTPNPDHLPALRGTIVCLEIGSPKKERQP